MDLKNPPASTCRLCTTSVSTAPPALRRNLLRTAPVDVLTFTMFLARVPCTLLNEPPRDALKQLPRLKAMELTRSEEHTSELQSHLNLVYRLLLEKMNSCTR